MNRYILHEHKLPSLDHLFRVGTRIKYKAEVWKLADGSIINKLKATSGTVVQIVDFDSVRYRADDNGIVYFAFMDSLEHE